MRAQLTKSLVAFTGCLAILTAGCGEYARQGSSPVQVAIDSMAAASGASPATFGSNLHSDVVTVVHRTQGGQQVDISTIFNDIGQVTMHLVLKDPGTPTAPTLASPINEVTFTRYRVTYRRSDGRNTPGVDVPFAFDSAATFTVPSAGTVTASFDIVRHTAKEEAPLASLVFNNNVFITTIAEVQFFGKDQAGHDVTAAGSIGITFGNFGDPA